MSGNTYPNGTPPAVVAPDGVPTISPDGRAVRYWTPEAYKNACEPEGPFNRGTRWQSSEGPAPYCSRADALNHSEGAALASDWQERRAVMQADPANYAPDPMARAHKNAGSMISGFAWGLALLALVLIISAILTA